MSGFRSSVWKVLQGSLGAQIIGFAALPLFSRLYQPEDFGHFQIFQVVIGFLMVIVTLRYEIAIVQAQDEFEFNAITNLCLWLCGLMTCLALVVGWGLALFTDWLSPEQRLIAWLLPLGVAVGGTVQMLTYVQLREQSFDSMSLCKVAQAGSYSGIGALAGLSVIRSAGLIVADTLSKLVSVAVYVWLVIRSGKRLLPPTGTLAMRQMAHKYRELPMVTATGGLINAAGGMMTGGLIYSLFGAFESGQYGLVERSVTLPIAMIGGVLSQVFTAKLSESVRERSAQINTLYRKLVGSTCLMGLLPSAVLLLVGPELFSFAFGNSWRLAGEYAQIMAPLFFFTFIMSPINMTIMLIGWQKVQFAWEVGRLVLLSLGWWWINELGLTSKNALLFHVIANVCMIAIFVVVADYLTRKMSSGFRLDSPQFSTE